MACDPDQIFDSSKCGLPVVTRVPFDPFIQELAIPDPPGPIPDCFTDPIIPFESGLCPTLNPSASVSLNSAITDPTIEFTIEPAPGSDCTFDFTIDLQLPTSSCWEHVEILTDVLLFVPGLCTDPSLEPDPGTEYRLGIVRDEAGSNSGEYVYVKELNRRCLDIGQTVAAKCGPERCINDTVHRVFTTADGYICGSESDSVGTTTSSEVRLCRVGGNPASSGSPAIRYYPCKFNDLDVPTDEWQPPGSPYGPPYDCWLVQRFDYDLTVTSDYDSGCYTGIKQVGEKTLTSPDDLAEFTLPVYATTDAPFLGPDCVVRN